MMASAAETGTTSTTVTQNQINKPLSADAQGNALLPPRQNGQKAQARWQRKQHNDDRHGLQHHRRLMR
jgi:hypothetical protein